MNIPEKIYCYEQPEERAVLQACCEPVQDNGSLKPVLQKMFQLLHESGGIGLAAPQVGINQRFFIIEIEKDNPFVFINPEIIFTSKEQTTREEGCLSLPQLCAKVTRPACVTVQARDASYKLFTLEAKELLATCIQHEFDHLNGMLFIDHLDEKHKAAALKRYDKLVQKRQKRGGK